MHRVVALALPHVVAFDLSIPAQVFGHPDERDRYLFGVCTPLPGLVPTTTNFSVQVSDGIHALARADTVIIPGYIPHVIPDDGVCEALREAAARGARMVSVCTGAFALAGAGLLEGRRAATHWRDADELARRHPGIEVDADVLFVDEAPVFTSAGLAAGIDLCIHLVRLDHGSELAASVARRMVVAPHRDGGQAQFLERPVPSVGAGLSATCQWMLDRLSEPITVEEMARHAGWSARTFARRFVAETGLTPLRWLTCQRVFEARRLLESSELSIDQVAARSGLGSAANLRVHLARGVSTTPTSYRRTYRGPGDRGPGPSLSRRP